MVPEGLTGQSLFGRSEAGRPVPIPLFTITPVFNGRHGPPLRRDDARGGPCLQTRGSDDTRGGPFRYRGMGGLTLIAPHSRCIYS